MTEIETDRSRLPGEDLDIEKMPGHWLLARMGKRVLRPGGLETTRALLEGLDIGESDHVVEFAPGLGATAKLILAQSPASYVGIERDADAARFALDNLGQFDRVAIRTAAADDTGLPDGCATVVVGEAMLSMNTQEHKERIASEAFRLLRPGGLYGVHELCIAPEDIAPEKHAEINRTLSTSIHVGARPLSLPDWRALMTGAGFEVASTGTAPMHLLRPKRLIQDEGLLGALRIARNVALNGAARKRILGMRRIFERYQDHLAAVFMIARKPAS